MIDAVSHFLHRGAGRHGPVMLMYHSVTPGNGNPGWPWAVSMRRFRSQLDFLAAEGWTTPTQAELIATPERFQGRSAVITFDDGYVDNLAACEELQKRSLRATWFVVAGSIGQAPGWVEDGRPPGRLLNAHELRQMQEAGMEIGSHGLTHTRLTQIDDASLHRELHASRATLEQALGKPVASFAYPYGAWDARCAEAVRAAGYLSACTTRTGWALHDGDPYRLRRLTVFNTDSENRFVRKLSLGSHDVSWKTLTRYGLERLRRRTGV